MERAFDRLKKHTSCLNSKEKITVLVVKRAYCSECDMFIEDECLECPEYHVSEALEDKLDELDAKTELEEAYFCHDVDNCLVIEYIETIYEVCDECYSSRIG